MQFRRISHFNAILLIGSVNRERLFHVSHLPQIDRFTIYVCTANNAEADSKLNNLRGSEVHISSKTTRQELYYIECVR